MIFNLHSTSGWRESKVPAGAIKNERGYYIIDIGTLAELLHLCKEVDNRIIVDPDWAKTGPTIEVYDDYRE